MTAPLLWWLPGFGGGSGSGEEPAPSLYGNPSPIFCTPFYSDGGQWSGGSWRTALPLANVADDALHRVARSSNLALSSTQLQCFFGAVRPIGAIVVPAGSWTRTARWRITLALTQPALVSDPVYQTGWALMWPGDLSREDAAGISVGAVHLPEEVHNASWGWLQFNDAANPAGYLDVARAVFAGIYAPSHAMSVGAKAGLRDASERVVTDGGSALYRRRPIERTWEFTLDRLEEPEAFVQVQRMQRLLGRTKQLYFVFDRYDPYMAERSFLCTMEELSGVEWPYSTELRAAFRLLEVVGAAGPVPSGVIQAPSRPSTIALIGDSITWFGTGWDIGVVTQHHARAAFVVADALLSATNQRLTLLHNWATPGWSLGSIAGSVADVVAMNPKPGFCLVEGGVNDIISNLPLADAETAWFSIMDQLIAAGITPIATTLMALGALMMPTPEQVTKYHALNAFIREQCETRGIVLCDWHDVTAEPGTDTPKANTYVDDTHPGAPSGYLAGALLADVLAPLIPIGVSPLPDPTNPANDLFNGALTGTTGSKGPGVTGDVATNWTAQFGTTTSTAVASKVVVASREWQQLQIASTATDDTLYLQQQTLLGWSVGQTLRAYCELDWGTDWVGIIGPSLVVTCYNADDETLRQSIELSVVGSSQALPAVAHRVVAITPDIIVPTGTTLIRVGVTFRVQAGGSGTLRAGRISLRSV